MYYILFLAIHSILCPIQILNGSFVSVRKSAVPIGLLGVKLRLNRSQIIKAANETAAV